MAIFIDLEQRGLHAKLIGTVHLNTFAKYLITSDRIEGFLRSLFDVGFIAY